MNIKTSDSGAVTERWFSMLGDIKKITVITGAGSPIYGSGAIAGVINIETFNADDKQGLEIGAKLGAGEQFGMAEISYATEIFDNSKLYFYYGVDKYSGADEDKAPLQFAFDYNGPYLWNSNIVAPADEPYPYATTNDAASLNHQLRHKVHLQLQNENYLIWARYTNSSLENALEQKMFQWLSNNNAYKYQHSGTQNQQFTLFGEYKTKPAQDLLINYNLSYQRSSLYTHLLASKSSLGLKAWREDNFVAKIYGNYNYNNDNLFAFGSEFTYNWLGQDSEIGFKEYSYINKNLNDKEWNTNQLSFFGEYQKHFNSKLTMFVGARADKHSYLEWIYSPRISFVYNINSEDIFKLNWNHSNRYSDEADLYLNHLSQEQTNQIEEIDSLEFIYTKYLSNLQIELSTFYNKHKIIAYDSTLQQTANLGKVYSYGGELQINYQYDKFLFNFSHSFTKLQNFTLNNPNTATQSISAMPYGFGDDFANYNTNITKIRLNYNFTPQLKWINSLRIFWDLQGGEDMANYNISLQNSAPDLYKLPYYEDGHTEAFQESIYYNTSLLWDLNKKTSIGIYGYNLLGIFNKRYNKRNFYHYTSQYREMAPSLAFGLKYKFD
jgi:outer membrane receptor protein involved in Fe transport